MGGHGARTGRWGSEAVGLTWWASSSSSLISTCGCLLPDDDDTLRAWSSSAESPRRKSCGGRSWEQPANPSDRRGSAQGTLRAHSAALAFILLTRAARSAASLSSSESSRSRVGLDDVPGAAAAVAREGAAVASFLAAVAFFSFLPACCCLPLRVPAGRTGGSLAPAKTHAQHV